MERGWREISPNCPRCGSSNTKFCYYNNYSLTQPRYFCKGCRRYWTKGGSLRNVPVGGGCRKSRRSRSSTLRLATSNHHNGSLNPSRVTTNSTMFDQHGHSNNTIANSIPTSINQEVPTIDLAVVYANFLNPKPENNEVNIPNGFEVNIPDATHIGPTSSQLVLQQDHANVVDCNTNNNNPSSFSQGLISLPIHLSNNNENHEQNQMFLEEFSRPMLHHHDIIEISSIQHEDDHQLGLPPLPGESIITSTSWAPSSNNLQAPRILDHMELQQDSQFSNNLFVGNWSPLDLPGFETTSSSSSKP